VRLAEKFLSLGSPLPAYDVATDGLKTWPDNVRLKQLQSLALIRVSAFQRARVILEALNSNEGADSETIGLLASVHKSTGLSTQIARTRLRELRQARELYLDGFRRFGLTWHGINAASLSLLLGQRRMATAMAKQILEISLKELESAAGDRYWSASTGGEAALLLGEVDEARDLYAQAGAVRSTRVGDLVTTRRNAMLVAHSLGIDVTWLDAVLPVPKVAVFAGHMIDLVGRPSPRFPKAAVLAVKKAIRSVISELGNVVGYTSAAAGGDILFAEAVLDKGGELHVVLPQSWPGFSAESIEPHGIHWVRRAELVLQRAASVTAVSDYRISSEGPAFSYGSRVLHGRARLHADRLQQPLVGLCVWDRKEGDGPGGTADAVRSWRRNGLEPTIIDPTVFAGASKLRKSRSGGPDGIVQEHRSWPSCLPTWPDTAASTRGSCRHSPTNTSASRRSCLASSRQSHGTAGETVCTLSSETWELLGRSPSRWRRRWRRSTGKHKAYQPTWESGSGCTRVPCRGSSTR
jgi:hypothetical protein